MLTRIIALLMIIGIASPLWPIGENPLVGDPFVIVNKQTNELAYVDEGEVKKVYPVATGKTKDLTPEGTFTMTVKAVDPYYRKENIEGGDESNPLGTRWIGFDAEDTIGRTYGVHGTNQPSSIGEYRTAGCVRMHNEDVEELYANIPIGTKVLVVDSTSSFEELAKNNGAIQL
ncbi:L,D-transpeptidase [Desertibacillus haloalkaliphilus]|uniref:L,D-transpeptidase n=1 Tax=Desertibacillus haloalkaliphilus TaxID=1328930 RepID=UPI001C25F95C|nr:L,D-transpeptidase [Desertibacillus haloalkaliphilus]MBU8907771.1 L,D-transpeptidase [Desertibacillus haloalkaliphilus]